MAIDLNKKLNQIFVFFSGLFISAIIFVITLKIFSGWGIFIALVFGFSLNYWLKKNYAKHYLLKYLNIGLFTFNIITAIIGLISYITVYSALQNMLN